MAKKTEEVKDVLEIKPEVQTLALKIENKPTVAVNTDKLFQNISGVPQAITFNGHNFISVGVGKAITAKVNPNAKNFKEVTPTELQRYTEDTKNTAILDTNKGISTLSDVFSK